MTPGSVELGRRSWEQPIPVGDGTEAGTPAPPPPHGASLLPEVTEETGEGTRRDQQEGVPKRPLKSIEGDIGSSIQDEGDPPSDREHHT